MPTHVLMPIGCVLEFQNIDWSDFIENAQMADKISTVSQFSRTGLATLLMSNCSRDRFPIHTISAQEKNALFPDVTDDVRQGHSVKMMCCFLADPDPAGSG